MTHITDEAANHGSRTAFSPTYCNTLVVDTGPVSDWRARTCYFTLRLIPSEQYHGTLARPSPAVRVVGRI